MTKFLIVAFAVGTQAVPEMCPSPSGWHPCDCIREVESGTRVEEVQEVETFEGPVLRLHHPNGTVEDVAHCPYTPPSRPHGTSDPRNVCDLGWPHAAPMEVFSQHNESIVGFSAEYVVPDAPSMVVGNILYYWIGLQDTSSAANPVIQPVLSYYPGSSPNNWYFESWNCCPAGHKIKSTSVSVSGPGARLLGAMTRTGTHSVVNSTNELGNSSVLIVSDSNIITSWNWVDMTLETYNVDSCDQYSAGSDMIFGDMSLTNADGEPVTPKFVSKPYIDGSYLTAKDSATFTACCGGTFDTAHWPRATMHQN